MSHKNSITNNFTERLFREFYQEVFSSLMVKFGSKNVDLIEDALQEAFYKALKSWKYDEMPSNPKGWLFTVTKNYLLNQLKKKQKNVSLNTTILEIETIPIKEKEDAQLKLLLLCAQLEIKEQSKLIFALKSICGFGVSEIASSLLISEESIYKQLQRTKQKLQVLPKAYFENQQKVQFTDETISYVTSIIYFMFNEGYDSFNSSSNTAIRKEICFEAIRLAHLLEKSSKKESIKNLLAMCYFHIARFDARVDVNGEFISLRKQNRSKWDDEFIQLGFRYLLKPKKLNRYYIEALIISIHLGAKTFSHTNWKETLTLYNVLLQITETPIIRLNRAICMFELNMNNEALKELAYIKPLLEDKYLYFSVSMADYLEDKDIELSKLWYNKSLKNTKQNFRKQIITSKLDEIS